MPPAACKARANRHDDTGSGLTPPAADTIRLDRDRDAGGRFLAESPPDICFNIHRACAVARYIAPGIACIASPSDAAANHGWVCHLFYRAYPCDQPGGPHYLLQLYG